MPDDEKWVGVDDVAGHLGINRITVYRWIEKRNMPASKIGRIYRFRLSEVDAWMKNADKDALSNDNNGDNK